MSDDLIEELARKEVEDNPIVFPELVKRKSHRKPKVARAYRKTGGKG